MTSSRCILLFTKAARPGRVKTRLIGDLTAEQTATLHSAFVDDVTQSLRQGAFDLRVAWGSEDGQISDLPEALRDLQVEPQHSGDLGQRLYHGLLTASERYECVAAVGSDHPEIEAATVDDAFERLESGADVVLGPADDGGYFLIAVRRQVLQRQLFNDIAWSTATVCEATVQRCQGLGLKYELLDTGHDIDVAADLAALIERLKQHPGGCPQTRGVLSRWGYDL